jgi:hypothetical protein
LGRGATNYGELTAENFVHLIENFARTTAPSNPQIGQLWYHLNAYGNGNHILKVCRNNTSGSVEWISIEAVSKDLVGSVSGSGKPSNPSTGTLYWNGSQLEVYNGSSWRLVGPMAATSANDVYYDTITATDDTIHDVIVISTGGTPVTIFSKSSSSFIPKPGTTTAKNTNLSKFPSINGGININNDYTAGTVFDPQNISNHLLPGGDTSVNLGSPSRRWGYVYSRTLQADYLRTSNTSGNWAGDIEITSLLRSNMHAIPSMTGAYNLGSNDYKWNNLYAKTINAETIQVAGSSIDMTKFMKIDTNNIPTDTTLNLGSSSFPWNNVYATNIRVNTLYFGVSSSSSVSVSNLARKDTNIIPTQTNQYSLGDATKKFSEVYASQAYFDTITMTGTLNNIDTTKISRIDQVEENTAQKNFKAVSLSGTSITWNLNEAQTAFVDLTIAKTINNPQNMVDGGKYVLMVQQNSAGGYSFNFPAYSSVYKFEGTIPSVLNTPDAMTIFEFISDGQYMYCTNVKKYS